MTNRDGRVAVQQKQSHGLADNIATAENHGVGALDGNIISAKDLHASRGRASDQPGPIADEHSHADGMKAVDILRGIDRLEDPLRIDLRRQGKLDENAINIVIRIEVPDKL